MNSFCRRKVWVALKNMIDRMVLGKTNCPEFGLKGITEPELHGPTRNPWNTNHTPGGSSGGSAAAIAGGMEIKPPCCGSPPSWRKRNPGLKSVHLFLHRNFLNGADVRF